LYTLFKISGTGSQLEPTKTKRDTLSKYVKEEKMCYAKNFLVKYSEKTLLDNAVSAKLDSLIKGYENSVELAAKEPVNKKNKALTVKSVSDNEIKTFDSIMDTVRYFYTQGIQLDRKSINNKIDSGKPYKGYIFQYKKD
jgi:hypothetical protein